MISGSTDSGQGFPPDPTILSLTALATDALKAHLRRDLERMLNVGWEGPEAVDAWRAHWADVLDAIVADMEQ